MLVPGEQSLISAAVGESPNLYLFLEFNLKGVKHASLIMSATFIKARPTLS